MISEKQRLLEALSQAVARGQEAVDAFDEAASERIGLHRTDLRCLGVLGREGPISPSELATKVDLSRPATTAALDRLAKAGYVRRVHGHVDRRRVRIEVTAAARRAIQEIWGPVAADGLARASAFSVSELRLILDFLRANQDVQEQHARRLRGLARRGPAARPASRTATPVNSSRDIGRDDDTADIGGPA